MTNYFPNDLVVDCYFHESVKLSGRASSAAKKALRNYYKIRHITIAIV